MTPESWQLVKERLAEALALEGERREAFVAGLDPEVRAEVQGLLAADGRLADALEGGAVAQGAAPATWVGRRLGPYELTGLLGEGGMGVVYRARRADGAFEREVAIKVLRRAFLAPQFLERFHLERKILARLEHPAIAQLLDGGETGEGDPYLVMERVEGVSIDRYCAEHNLTVPARIALFREVCAAVQYAHSNLVVHRDLKPGNILVTAEGRPKLLDFGIAREVDADGSDATRHTMLPVMTLEYASPEQVRAERVTTVSDVYSLGVLLYVLLTGRRPYRVRDATSPELIRAICEGDALRPSVALTAPASRPLPTAPALEPGAVRVLRSMLSGDLDAIVLKAMRRDPADRYQTAERLADDLRRHAEGLPVAARRGTRGYLLRKFVRRHALGVGLAAAATAVLVGGLVAITALNLRLRAASLETASALAESRAVADFLEQDMLNAADPRETERTDLPVREVLAAASRKIDARFVGQPLIAAAVHRAVGQSWAGAGDLKNADHDYQSALELLKGRADARSRALRLETVNSMTQDHYDAGEYDVARRMLALAMPFTDSPLSSEEQDQRQQMRILEGEVRNQLGDSEAGLAEIEAVVREIVAARGSKDPVSLLARNAWLNSLVDAGQLERGEQELRTLIADVQGDHSGVISALGLRENLANALVARGKPEEAIAIAEPLYAEESRLYGAAGQSTISVGNTLAVAYDNSNHMDKAEALYRELIANGQRTLGTDSGRVLGTMANLAVHYQIQQRWADSVALERQALAVYERKGEGATRPALLSRRSIARSLQNMGQWDESARDIRETIALASKHLAADDVLQSILAVDLAALALHAGNRAEAVRLLAAATPKILKEMGPDHAVSQRVMKLREQAGMPPPTPGG